MDKRRKTIDRLPSPNESHKWTSGGILKYAFQLSKWMRSRVVVSDRCYRQTGAKLKEAISFATKKQKGEIQGSMQSSLVGTSKCYNRRNFISFIAMKKMTNIISFVAMKKMRMLVVCITSVRGRQEVIWLDRSTWNDIVTWHPLSTNHLAL